MGEDRVARRALLGVGVGALASLAGCSGLFIEETATPTRGTGTPTATATARPTTRRTETPRATPTERPLRVPSENIEVENRAFVFELSQLEKFATIVYRFDVENTSGRTISDVEFRLRVRYEHEDYSRIVATSYPRFWFDSDDDDDDDGRDGLPADETERVRGTVRFERDGQAQESTDPERFSLELTVRRIRFL
ncbi:hypothetical protein SAMN04488065_1684 [Haloplanus vescus]|uniref:Uncharacterized protein n=1 Tax=Haloplanus vescus TaxID=555874 RepID=A0A1H3Y5W4_9EURY|nr:hypothetical protein [Haloplanus vescus]SEA07045.1 hypothetical protein SAMN04488065_1684 [Haloplanus vescus]